jgi:hypothetical protein
MCRPFSQKQEVCLTAVLPTRVKLHMVHWYTVNNDRIEARFVDRKGVGLTEVVTICRTSSHPTLACVAAISAGMIESKLSCLASRTSSASIF